MSASITWNGLLELRAHLRELPERFAGGSRQLARLTADAHLRTLEAAYSVGGTGNLRRGLRVTEPKTGPYKAAVVVRSTAQHAHIFEDGTKKRRAYYRNGKLMRRPANRGVMPAADIFVRNAIRERSRLWLQLKDLVERAGLVVRGG